jgi:hypothetical protein
MKRYYFLLILLIIFSSCEKTENVIEYPRHNSKIAVNCFFAQDEYLRIFLSKSLSPLDNKIISEIKKAEIKLFENGEQVVSQVYHSSDGDYIVAYKPKAGKTYKLEVSTDNLEKVMAQDVLPASPVVAGQNFQILDSSYYQYNNGQRIDYGGALKGRVKILLNDNPAEENYYQVKVGYISEYIGLDSIPQSIFNEFYGLNCKDPSVLQNFSNSFLLSDKFFNGQNHEIIFTFSDDNKWGYHYYNLKPDSEIYVIITSLSKAGYLYVKTAGLYSENYGDPFAEPVRVFNNIENGYGIFAGFSETKVRIH